MKEIESNKTSSLKSLWNWFQRDFLPVLDPIFLPFIAKNSQNADEEDDSKSLFSSHLVLFKNTERSLINSIISLKIVLVLQF